MKIKKTTTIVQVLDIELKKHFYGAYLDLLKDALDDALDSFEDFETNIDRLSDAIHSIPKTGYTPLFKDGYTMMLLPEVDFNTVEEFFNNGSEAQEELEVRVFNLAGDVVETVKHTDLLY